MADPRVCDLSAAASELEVSRATLRRWISEGAPVTRRGRRGRGCVTLVDPVAINAWRSGRLATAPDAGLRVFADRIPEILADAVMETFQAVQGSHKRPSADVLAAAWYLGTTRLLDAIRAEGLEVADPSAMPAKIAQLRAINGS